MYIYIYDTSYANYLLIFILSYNVPSFLHVVTALFPAISSELCWFPACQKSLLDGL